MEFWIWNRGVSPVNMYLCRIEIVFSRKLQRWRAVSDRARGRLWRPRTSPMWLTSPRTRHPYTQGTGPPWVSQEDHDVFRALEASLLESGVTRRKKDPQNPHDRERDSGRFTWQTCWFSAVIECLFHIPSFRMLVLNFTPPQVSIPWTCVTK